MSVDPVRALAGWAAEDAEGRVMTIVEDPSFADWVPMVLARLSAAETAVGAARQYQRRMAEVAQEWREDWSDFDGRTLRNQEADASAALVAALAACPPPESSQPNEHL